MARRGENIYKRKDGRWEGRISNGYSINGRKQYRSVYAQTYAGVKSKMKEAQQEEKNKKEKPDCLMEDAFRRWLEDKRYTWKASTYACYLQLIERQLIPAVGSIPIQNCNSTVINYFIEEKRREGFYSESYIRDMTSLILQALRHMKQYYQMDLIIPAGISRKEISMDKRLPERETIRKLENYLLLHADDSTCLGILLCCYTGLRIGEVCALQWKDIDRENRLVRVRKTMQRVNEYENGIQKSRVIVTPPKTKRSTRDITIPPIIYELLERYRKSEDQYIIQGSKVCYAEPRTVQYRFQGILNQCGIENFNFHTLRHVFATRCIMLGFDINSLSELLGHSNVQITMNRYVHSSYERKRSLMEHFQL